MGSERRSFKLSTCANEEQARERVGVLAELSEKLRGAGLAELAPDFIERDMTERCGSA
ncbi:MAG: hypothetical protein HUU21_17055 [Polyangiaceae bacterium]|nr:hypothetical protein [Polyangiaceae bacterium]